MIDTTKKIEKALKVWVLVLDNENGTNISVHTTQDDAREALYEYCLSQWADWMDEKYGMADYLWYEQVIDICFSRGEHWYVLQEHGVQVKLENDHLVEELVEALELINVDDDGDGFICREAMPQVWAAIEKAKGEN